MALPTIIAGNVFHGQGRCTIGLEGVTAGSQMEGPATPARGKFAPMRNLSWLLSCHSHHVHSSSASPILTTTSKRSPSSITYFQPTSTSVENSKGVKNVARKSSSAFIDMLVLEEDERLGHDGGEFEKVL
jgi:hypothetical protein